MARISIYVTDELKARMDEIGEAANWSEAVRPALLSEVTTHEYRKGASMATVVERLRASKEKHLQEAKKLGLEAGRAWASNDAEYDELLRVANWWNEIWPQVAGRLLDPFDLKSLIDPDDNLTKEEVDAIVGRDGFEHSDEWAEGFAEGAAEVYDEVKGELGR